MVKSGKLVLAFFVLTGLLALVFFRLLPSLKSSQFSQVIINGSKFSVEVADEEEERKRGLSERLSLDEKRGMLFIFPNVGDRSFWMKDMKFNLDFVFIRKDQVVDLVKDVPFPPSGEPVATVNSRTSFDMVLEVNAGTIEKDKIKLGDKVAVW